MSARDPSAPGLSVVVLSWNTRELLGACLSALARDTAREPREILVVDNGSRDGSAEMVARDFPTVRLLHNAENRLYAEGNNQGARAATGRYLCLLNSDTEVRPGALDRLVEFLETHPEYGAAAPKLVNADGSVQRACSRFPTLLDPLFDSTALGLVPPGSWLLWWIRMGDFDHEHSRDVPQPPGACFCMRRDEYVRMGGLDEQLSLFFNDVDLSKRLWRAGRAVHYLATAEVMHHRGASTKSFARMLVVWHKNRIAYYKKHYGSWVVLWLWLCIRLRVLEEWLAIGRRCKGDRGRRDAERAHLRAAVEEMRAS